MRGVAHNNTTEGVLAWFADGFTPTEKREFYQNSSTTVYGFQRIDSLLQSLESFGALDRALALDLLWELPGDLLVKMDIASMAYGLEARSPFLDHELVEWANTLPDDVRLPRLTTKALLRNLARRYLPAAVVEAPKRGFEAPLYQWLQQELQEMSRDLLLSQTGIVCMLFRRPRVEQLLQKPQGDPRRWVQLVWILFMLAAWDRYHYRH
jgi:asparagine synthase (glutamine-hydrolysing)